MRIEDLDHKRLLELDPDNGVIRFAGQRALLIDATAMGLLRKYLVENFGLVAARTQSGLDVDGRYTELRWFVEYNTLGSITAFIDPEGNTRRYSCTYHYDAPAAPFAGAQNVKGKLSYVEWPTGSLPSDDFRKHPA